MTAKPLSPQTAAAIKEKLDAACIDRNTGIPGAVFVSVDRDGETFAYAGGTRGLASKEPMTLDSVFSLFSCTKLITTIACMQLVEKGVLSLDDADQVERLAPELKDVKVLKDGVLVPKTGRITLRHLLTHTAGFSYSFFREELRDLHPGGYNEFSGHISMVDQPLIAQPGEKWEYGISMDWAGILVERATGQKLGDYMQQHIFEPLGITEMSFLPTESMKKNLAYMNQRAPDGTLHVTDHLLNRSLSVKPEEDLFHSGGGGLFGKPQDYCKIISVLLNDGVSSQTGNRILQKSTVDEMFRNQIPQFPDFGRQGITAAKKHLTNDLPDLSPNPGKPQGWGLSFMLAGSSPTGRSETTASWGGLANLFWWADRENGVGGMIATQILPFADMKVIGLLIQLEALVYADKKA
ncbi:hypothetical protein VTN49DRAFT_6827 [Thermomyces lanuginosus]|uniref:uncharacterized protein n=1 Tax=Thermomyces lanuginosus TaxID=5541 RepID=UPI003742C17D